MDASELEGDAKLYKASAELLSELQARLPQLVSKHSQQGGPQDIRRWVINTKTYVINTKLLDRFQEWPQLLDSSLAQLMQTLVEAYLTYCTEFPEEYIRKHTSQDEVTPLPRAVASVITALCKVRGRKVIVRLLNNEPKYLEPLLTSFYLWTSGETGGPNRASGMVWEERYIMLLWLSHLMLAPFQLSSISALQVYQQHHRDMQLMHDLPDIAQNLLGLALDHIQVPSKAREAAVALAVRLALRGDMQEAKLPTRMVQWAIDELQIDVSDGDNTGYNYIGLLSLLFGLMNAASDSETAPFLIQVFQKAHLLTTSESHKDLQIRDSAPARKLLVKILRSCMLHAISLTGRNTLLGMELESMLEDTIQTLLEYLADRDTPVRQAASKALSMIALKLGADLAAEIGEAVLGCLEENMLLEDVSSGELIAATSVLREESNNKKKNVNAVNPLLWHGAMLTLGHLIFRRALPSTQLPAIIEALLIGLEFEQRSNVGTSIGVGVRDGACFGVWSLARKYSTAEMIAVPLSISMLTTNQQMTTMKSKNAIQLIATHLVIASCLDPSGNLRRGASAALQELIGRHPDVIIHGIPVVQVVDYNGVARRSRAITEVAVAASKLDPEYHHALLYALLQWRGARATDADSRRQASLAVAQLLSFTSGDNAEIFLKSLMTQIASLRVSNLGSNASARHGLLLCLASAYKALSESISPKTFDVFSLTLPHLRSVSSLIGEIGGRVTADIEYVLESLSKIISAALLLVTKLETIESNQSTSIQLRNWINPILPVLDRCTVASEKTFVTDAAAEANLQLLKTLDEESASVLLSSWLNERQQKTSDYASKGRIVTIGKAFELVTSNNKLAPLSASIIAYFCEIIKGNMAIETKVYAMQSINIVASRSADLANSELQRVVDAVVLGLSDYTMDQRGDIGSLLRLQSIATAQSLIRRIKNTPLGKPIQQLVVKLAAEKLVKVRFQAWICLKTFWADLNLPAITNQFDHQADVSLPAYFKTLTALLRISFLREYLVMGLISSVAAGTDDISRACSDAIVVQMLDYDHDTRQSLMTSIIMSLCRHLDNSAQDERDLVPTIDFLSFLLEHLIISRTDIVLDDTTSDSIWKTTQKIHTPSSTISRLEALVRLYATILHIPPLRTRALDRLTRMLLHKWPKIRSSAAEYIFLSEYMMSMIEWDWNRPVTECKPIVLQVRKELDVAGKTVTVS